MSRFDVFILPDAEAEIEAAFLWYQDRNPEVADAFRAEVFECIDGLTDDPEKWKMDEWGTQRCLLRHFPYTVFYEISGKDVFVLAVAHRRREPGYWRRR